MIKDNIFYVGVNDRDINLFEGQYVVENGMAYNSYVIMDEKIAVMDTVDANFTHEWLDNVANVLGDRKPDYLIVQHMEPDHSANIASFVKAYPNVTVVGNAKTFVMMKNFFGGEVTSNTLVVENGGTLTLGKHELTFVFAPMVHWPEVMVTYDSYAKVLFSADGFGKFGTIDADEEWDCEARRYYFGIVGKYGMQVQNLLKKASTLDIQTICPLHGPILTENLEHYINLYNTWSSYMPESDGIVIAYTSVYGNTKKAVDYLAKKLKALGAPKVQVTDLARDDMAEAVEDAFRYGKLVLATTTYNADIFPFMKTFIEHLVERGYKNRTIGFIENGSWAPMAKKIMQDSFVNSKNITLISNSCTIKSAISEESMAQLDAMAQELCSEYIAQDELEIAKTDFKALNKIGYGLYVVTSNDGKRDNGLIVNTVSQVADNPQMISVTINKANYSHHVIKQSGKLNVNCLTVDTPFSIFKNFGFQSGRTVDKFKNITPNHAKNGLAILPQYANSVLCLKVENYVDLGSHGMFICSIEDARVLNDKETMTYAYYRENVKPKPDTEGKKGFVCKICGFVYEGDELPADYICPLCKHGVADFEPIK